MCLTYPHPRLHRARTLGHAAQLQIKKLLPVCGYASNNTEAIILCSKVRESTRIRIRDCSHTGFGTPADGVSALPETSNGWTRTASGYWEIVLSNFGAPLCHPAQCVYAWPRS